MKNFLFIILVLLISGCNNLSPRQEQKINNENGKIGEIENMANSMKAEIGNLKSQNEIQNSKIGQIQQGMVNWQSKEENNGVQILSGSGGLVVSILAIIAATVIILHYRKIAIIQEKTSEILAQSIASRNDEDLNEQVFQMALYTDAEENILHIMNKHKPN